MSWVHSFLKTSASPLFSSFALGYRELSEYNRGVSTKRVDVEVTEGHAHSVR